MPRKRATTKAVAKPAAKPALPDGHVRAHRSAVDAVLERLRHLADNPADIAAVSTDAAGVETRAVVGIKAALSQVMHDALDGAGDDGVPVHEADWRGLADDIGRSEGFDAAALCQAVELLVGMQRRRKR